MRFSLKHLFIIIGALCLLAACKPSDKYAGEWYALAHDGKQVMVNFSKEKVLTITDDAGNELEEIEFNQTQTGFINQVSYYGIDTDEGFFYIIFDNKKDEANAKLMKQTNHASDFDDAVGDIIFIMNRETFPTP